ncbi:bestrophin-like domain [Streptomyces carminius]|uniref:bestrophin-like domain n=1 Tax=Streptomyces carminius TaxID=2665496 RepID=UPI0013043ABA|nr:DUF4239 domain-containing protein [Streptomyces carminius]
MYYSAIADLPLWATALIILGGLPVLAVTLQALTRRVLPPARAKDHNDVAGFLVAVIGVVYAVTAGFTIADQWDNYAEARQDVTEEAYAVASVAEGAAVAGTGERREITAAAVAYGRAVVAWWPDAPGEAGDTVREDRAMERLHAAVRSVRPDSEAERAYVSEATGQLMRVSVLRGHRHNEAGTAHLEAPMWVAVVVVSAVTLLFSLLFGLERPWLHYVMVAGVALVVAVNLFLVLLLEYPLVGTLAVTSESFRELAREPASGI